MVAGICRPGFKILLAGTFKFKNEIPIFQYSNIPIFQYSDDTVIAMTSFLKFEIEISFLRFSHHLTLPTTYVKENKDIIHLSLCLLFDIIPYMLVAH